MKKLLELKKHIDADLKKVNVLIEQTLSNSSAPTLNKIYTHVLKSQGKQIRGSIILLISKLSNEITPDTHKLAAGIELIHLASLIHDDIIDNANIRRDIKTVHKEFDLNNGIISGVHCYALALKLITSIKNNDILTTISDSVIDLCEGECIQVNQRHNFSLTQSDYWTIVEKKTSALFKAACICSGLLNNQNKTDIKQLAEFGTHLGDIFQLADDYLDIYDSKNKLSKKVKQDLETGDISLPILLASENQKVTN